MTARRLLRLLRTLTICTGLLAGSAAAATPNILWIYVDDMSDWMGCYGDPMVPTPHIDALATSGVRFEKAYMPAPVCSATRSAIITGSMQTTHGLHQHRTMLKEPLPESITTIPEHFRAAGYLTFNESKDDYNFTRDRDRLYSPDYKRGAVRSHIKLTDIPACLDQLKGKQPFFGQLQLSGGKHGGETGAKYPMPSRVAEADVTVPPYYPDTKLVRNAIARHYEQIAVVDEIVGAIIARLKHLELLEDTAIFFFTDHGCPLLRAKQFLYEDGTKVPLIVSWPQGADRLPPAGTVRSDLVNGIDVGATSMALAGIPRPPSMESRDLFAIDYQPQPFVVSARDRCGIAVDRIRAIRSAEFRYIRNYQTDRAMYQAQYRDGFAFLKALRAAHAAGTLSPLQGAGFDAAQRQSEELYDLKNDPLQLRNLAADPTMQEVLKAHRKHLSEWQEQTGDQGRIPESQARLKAVYDHAKGKVEAPEFDRFRQPAAQQ